MKPPQKIPDEIQEKIRLGGKIRRIVVNRTLCIGARSCVAVAPGVFQMDDNNLAYITDANESDDDTVLLAAQSCPVLAIALFDNDKKIIFPN